MSDFNGLYDIRPALPEDMAFVMATFLRGLYYGDTWYQQVPKDIFMDYYAKAAAIAWKSPQIRITVACLKEDSNIILGYSITSADEKALVWMFVKSAWRKQGIGKSLLPANLECVTHLSTLGKSLIQEKLSNVIFNPFYGAT